MEIHSCIKILNFNNNTMGNKKEKTKKLLEDFTEKCKELDVQYLIAVGSDIAYVQNLRLLQMQ